jgi:hypothetical protein
VLVGHPGANGGIGRCNAGQCLGCALAGMKQWVSHAGKLGVSAGVW